MFRRTPMRPFLLLIFSSLLLVVVQTSGGQVAASTSPQPVGIRVSVVGLVHGHVDGFFRQYLHSPKIQIVGIAEPVQQLAAQYASRYGIDRTLLFTNLEVMLQKTHPQVVLIYTNTYDHRHVVEVCARQGVHVMMEKPLAVSLEHARAIARAAHE